MSKTTTAEREESLAWLRARLRPGATVYGIVRSVSASGMSRRIDLYTIIDGRLDYLTGHAAKVLGYSRSPDKNGMLVQGCGMDMVFHCVYTLATYLYRDLPADSPEFAGLRPHGTSSPGYLLRSEIL